MNERIKELAEQANVITFTRLGDETNIEELKLFTELIVQECCNIFLELRTRPADLAVLDVKKHFGIK